jgi:hypothetical protein
MVDTLGATVTVAAATVTVGHHRDGAVATVMVLAAGPSGTSNCRTALLRTAPSRVTLDRDGAVTLKALPALTVTQTVTERDARLERLEELVKSLDDRLARLELERSTQRIIDEPKPRASSAERSRRYRERKRSTE